VNGERSVRTIRLHGDLEISRKSEIRAALQAGTGASAVLVDLSGVNYADSTALTELLRVAGDARQALIPIAFVVATAQLARIVEVAGLRHAVAIFAELDAALAYLRERMGA